MPDIPRTAAPRASAALPLVQRIQPGTSVDLSAIDPAAPAEFSRKDAEAALAEERQRIHELQERLYAESRRGLLVVLQAMDTGGKDGVVKHVFSCVNPQGCRVWAFKTPTEEELAHDFLWRYHRRTPARGMIALFNRSHYEDVLIVRVKQLVPEAVWRERYAQINDFERMLTQNDVTLLKLFLHISKDEQRRRLKKRLNDPEKRWKFSPDDVRDRALWDDYQRAYADALTRCSTPHAPWHVVPADRKWFRNLAVARAVADTLAAMGPQFPTAPAGLEEVVVE